MTGALLNSLVMIFLLVIIGYIARKAKLFNDQLQAGLTALVLNISVPAAILKSANAPLETENLISILWVVAGGFAYFFVAMLLAVAIAKLLRLPSKQGTVFSYLVTFSNVAFIGYPIIRIFLPETGEFYTSFFIITFNLVFYTYGIARMAGTKGFSPASLFKNLPTLATFLMIILFLLQVKLPLPVQNTLGMLGDMSTPLSMLVIGSMLASARLRELFITPLLYLASFLRLLVLPTLMFATIKLLGPPQEAAIVLLVMSALPSASMTAIVAQQYDCEPQLASQGVLQSTLLFAGSLFYVVFLAGLL